LIQAVIVPQASHISRSHFGIAQFEFVNKVAWLQLHQSKDCHADGEQQWNHANQSSGSVQEHLRNPIS
jgi:hypothetical protein